MHIDVIELLDQAGQVLAPLAGARQEGLAGEVVGHRDVGLAFEVGDLVDHLGNGQGGGGVPIDDLLVAQADADHFVGVGIDDLQRTVDLGAGIGGSGDVDSGLDFDRKVQSDDRLQDAPGVGVGSPGAYGVEALGSYLGQGALEPVLILQRARGSR